MGFGGCLEADFDGVEGVADWGVLTLVEHKGEEELPESLAMPEKTPATKPL